MAVAAKASLYATATRADFSDVSSTPSPSAPTPQPPAFRRTGLGILEWLMQSRPFITTCSDMRGNADYQPMLMDPKADN